MLKWLTSLVLSFLALLPLPKTQVAPPSNSPAVPVTSSKYFYPVSDYDQRITAKNFGQFVTAEDAKKFPCGAPFTGYHTGDDLEIFPVELNTDVPVYSIADGKIISVSHINGYGGLIVISYTLGSQPVTVYYGHISLQSAAVRANQEVKAGEKLAILGNACSAQTDYERKHLHFAIHKGTATNYRGYVVSAGELVEWLNPSDVIKAS
jgi:murein DD-endopeptidase MepM/ murein hydrolase activator NlpD